MQDRDSTTPKPSTRYIVFPIIPEETSENSLVVSEPHSLSEEAELKIMIDIDNTHPRSISVALEEKMTALQVQLETALKQKEEAETLANNLNKERDALQMALDISLEKNKKLQSEKMALSNISRQDNIQLDRHRTTLQEAKNELHVLTIERQKMQNYLQKQLSLVQNELNQKQQCLNDTIDQLKKTQAELEEAQKDIVGINESYILEQKSHKDTCDELKQFTRKWANQFRQQSEYYDNQLLQAKKEISRLQNSSRLYSSVVKDGLFKEVPPTTNEKYAPTNHIKK